MINERIKSELKFELFYSKRFNRSLLFVKNIKSWLISYHISPESIKILEVEENIREWKQLGLMSCPAIVVLYGNPAIPISNLVNYASTEKVKELIEKIRLPNEIPKESPFVGKNKIPKKNYLGFFVEASSGTHRYLRWHEDNLNSADCSNGWTGVSRSNFKDYLICQLYSESVINEIILVPRKRSDGTESYKSFPKSLSLYSILKNNHRKKIWSKKNIFLNPKLGYFPIKLKNSIKGKRFEIIVDDKHNINGKTFPSIIQINFVGKSVNSNKANVVIKKGKLRNTYSEEILLKHGIYANKDIQIEQFNLVRNQVMPNCFFSKQAYCLYLTR